jgi:hypothetical protein
MTLSRRDFIKSTALLAGTGLLGYSGFSLAGIQGAEKNRMLVGAGKKACVVNLLTREVQSLELGFMPHSFLAHPLKPDHVIAVEKWGASVVEIDIKKNEVTNLLTSPPQTQFFGHGIFSPKGDILYISLGDFDSKKGKLIGYDSKTYKQILNYEVSVGGIHDSHYLPDGSLMLASSGRLLVPGNARPYGAVLERTSMITMNLSSGKVTAQRFVDDDNQNIGHIGLTPKGKLLGLSTGWGQTTDGHVNHGNLYLSMLNDTKFTKVTYPADIDMSIEGEFLSLAYDPTTDIALITLPDSKDILFIDIKTEKLIKRVHADKKYTSAAYDAPRHRFVYGGDGSMFTADMGDLSEKVFDLKVDKDMHLAGRHSLLI